MIRRLLVAFNIIFKREIVVFTFDMGKNLCTREMWSVNLRSLKKILDEASERIDIEICERETVSKINDIIKLRQQLDKSLN